MQCSCHQLHVITFISQQVSLNATTSNSKTESHTFISQSAIYANGQKAQHTMYKGGRD